MTLVAIRPLDAVPEQTEGFSPNSRAGTTTLRHGFAAEENAILDLLIAGRAAPEIACALQISKGSARYRIRKIYKKLHIRTRSDIATRVRDWNLAVTRLLTE
jgi:DNA-binding NarL/FixJ family response regulator